MENTTLNFTAAQKALAHSTKSAYWPVGIGGSQSSRILDSGLLMLSSHQPVAKGFVAFEPQGGASYHCSWRGILTATESLANKGCLWGYWRDPASGTGVVVVNTHLAAGYCPGATKQYQVEQLIALLQQLKSSYERVTDHFELYLVGDFNQEVQSPYLKQMQEETGLEPISTKEPTHRLG